MIRHEDIDDGHLCSKPHKVCCCPQCCLPCNCLFRPCRKAVSGKKRRIKKDGFDLDMAYVSPRIIVHGFPAVGIEHMYRNPRFEIKRFMDKHHMDNYKVYNFCCEPGRGYDPSVFHGRVERYPFKDHNTPPLETMAAFANSVKAWLDEDPAHVVNMHCKAGKGRAGLMSCVAMLRTGVAQSAQEALDIYDRERVTNLRGLTVTSQRKFVIFYEKLWREVWGVEGDIGTIPAEPLDSTKYVVPEQPLLTLKGIELLNMPPKFATIFRVTIFRITNFLPEKIFDSGKFSAEGGAVNVDLNTNLQGNFKIFISFKKGYFSKPVKLTELLHNTYFMDRYAPVVDFGVEQCDIKKKIKPKLGAEFGVRLRFTDDGTGTVGTKGYEMVATNGDEDGVMLGASAAADNDRAVDNREATSTSYTAVASDDKEFTYGEVAGGEVDSGVEMTTLADIKTVPGSRLAAAAAGTGGDSDSVDHAGSTSAVAGTMQSDDVASSVADSTFAATSNTGSARYSAGVSSATGVAAQSTPAGSQSDQQQSQQSGSEEQEATEAESS